jgi:AraC family transcriptional regulator
MAQWKLERALDYIEEHIDRDLSLEELSASLDMTPHYFGRLLRKSVGMPPHRYLITRIIERAKELLASTNKDMTAIALTVGFSSQRSGVPSATHRECTGTPFVTRRLKLGLNSRLIYN